MFDIRKKFGNLHPTNGLSLILAAHKGVRATVFYSFAHEAALTEGNLAALLNMHPRTIQNYKEKQKKLEPTESEHLLKLIALYIKGEEVFGNVTEFNFWLNKPSWRSKEKPYDFLITPGGVDLLSEELDRLAHGYPV